ncbi:D-aminoacyl-tRNA deacylase [Patescibacteria group bacterium]
MLVLIQRVSQAQVSVDQKTVGQINKGFLIFLGVVKGDTDKDLDYLVKKITNLRIMADKNQKMNLSLKDADAQVLVISQFTLAANVKKGNRPSFINAADPATGEKYYQMFIKGLEQNGLKVATGQFGAYMKVDLTNDGPTTIIIDSKKDL